jgi:hypothetical protein
VTFIFTDDVTNVPTDINGDNYFDTALAEVYYNDTFGHPATDRAGNPCPDLAGCTSSGRAGPIRNRALGV